MDWAAEAADSAEADWGEDWAVEAGSEGKEEATAVTEAETAEKPAGPKTCRFFS